MPGRAQRSVSAGSDCGARLAWQLMVGIASNYCARPPQVTGKNWAKVFEISVSCADGTGVGTGQVHRR